MNNHIHYIGQYAENIDFRNLRIFPSALTKMNYILSALKNANFKVHIFSPAETNNTFFCYYSRKQITIDDFESITYVNTFGGPTLLLRAFSRIWMMLQLLFFLLFEIKQNDKIIVYHCLAYKWPIKLAKIFRTLNLFFEVEELYHASPESSDANLQKEIKYLQNAKGYILVNDLMADKCGFINSPNAVCYGDYRMTAIKKGTFSDKNIHLVYAGVIGNADSDVYLSIETMRYLPLNYRLHILGYGIPEDVFFVKKRIDELNAFLGNELITFHGCLSGNEYLSFLSKCDIGLCTRVLVDKFSDYTFPSKVLVYLGNNLIPICSPISSVIHSQVSNYVVFSKTIEPQSIAESVLSIQVKQNIASGNILNLLDKKFIVALNQLLRY